MSGGPTFRSVFLPASLGLWVLLVLIPVVMLIHAAIGTDATGIIGSVEVNAVKSFALAAGISAFAVLLGWVPGRLLGTAGSWSMLILLLLVLPLMLPRYVLYYAWTLLLSPTTQLGAYLAARPSLARFTASATSSMVLVSWHWPLAALIMAQGWRSIDRQVGDSVLLDAGARRGFLRVFLPLMSRSILLAFGACFVLALSDFAAFHLAGVKTFGTELAVLYELTGEPGAVAAAAWPVAVAAAVAAVVAGGSIRSWFISDVTHESISSQRRRGRWLVLLLLVLITCGFPVGILLFNAEGTQEFRLFLTLHADDLAYSFLIAVMAALFAHLIGWGAVAIDDTADGTGRAGPGRRIVGFVLRAGVFLAMFVPGSLVASSLLETAVELHVPVAFSQSVLIVSAGQAVRFAGLAMIILMLTRYPDSEQLSQMARVDGASRLQCFLHVHLPRVWPVVAGGFILIIAFSVAELAATMVLLPAGLPNFAQRLLNQMHYARDQQVIASCLILVACLTIMAGAVVLLLGFLRSRRSAVWALILGASVMLTGCDRRAGGSVDVVRHFGSTGAGNGEFLYPRAIDYVGDGVLVVDKTGRIQEFDLKGEFRNCIEMPKIEAGKPTGLSLGPDGRLYVADTHYHRVLIFSADGEIDQEFGTFGREQGCFIYPTDVAFGPEGNIYIGEYGGNDRISVFDPNGTFLFCFGEPGNEAGQFSRPAALCSDFERNRLYIADACNHRVGVYDFQGNLKRYIGSAGRDVGQLRYPYDLALMKDGTLVVCEYGNNRLQLFDSDGNSSGVYGEAGRQLGQLAYPWGVAVDEKGVAFVVDAGNNRIQVWKF